MATISELTARYINQIQRAEHCQATAPLGQVLRQAVEDIRRHNHLPLPKAVVVDRLLRPQEAADGLGVWLAWDYLHASKLRFAKHVGRALRFSDRGLERYITNL